MQKESNLSKIIKNYSISGLDIGNCTCKSNTRNIFDSKITTVEPMNKTDKIIIDGKTYYLGYGEYDATYRKIDKKHYIDMLYSILALTSDTSYNYIGLGLPLNQYKQDRDSLIELVMQNSTKHIQLNDNEEKVIVIKDVEVFPEGVATLEDEFEGVVIDVGGLTTDCAMVINERGRRKILNPISIPNGTIKLNTNFINKLNNFFSLDLTLDDTERILKKGLPLDGELANIDFALEIYDEYINSLISQLEANYSLRSNYISLTGGGAEIVYKKLHDRFKKSLILQDNPIFANANNYYELACSVFEL
jgi:plasmid segregation protein ParM